MPDNETKPFEVNTMETETGLEDQLPEWDLSKDEEESYL